MKLWPEIKDEGWLNDILGGKKAVKYWKGIFERVYKGKIDAWGYQWTFASWVRGGLNIIPNVNLVSNIGFDSRGTHTTRKNKFSNMIIEPMFFPMLHPPFIIRDDIADNFTQKDLYFAGSLTKRLLNRFINLLK